MYVDVLALVRLTDNPFLDEQQSTGVQGLSSLGLLNSFIQSNIFIPPYGSRLPSPGSDNATIAWIYPFILTFKLFWHPPPPLLYL
jgi:hypothetical protein